MSGLREILESGSIIDVRAPLEFQGGSFPNALSAPLLLDDERKQVGTTYKRDGKDAAVALGHQLVSGEAKEERIARWLDLLDSHPEAQVCCARGGLRSTITCDWLGERGRPTAKVDGGFKALRHEALAIIEEAASERDWLILGGRTGSNKTALLATSPWSLDLEGAANHRGSSFGGFADGQPSQVTFENRLAVALARIPRPKLLVEDEGRNLGRLAIPEVLVQRMRRADVVVLEVPFEERVNNIARDYVELAVETECATELCVRYRGALARLKKRLGDKRWRELDELIERAFAQADTELHREWIGGVLTSYYDPMYDYQLSKKRERVVFSGAVAGVLDVIKNRGF